MSPLKSSRGAVIIYALLAFSFIGGMAIGVIGDRMAYRVPRASTRITGDISSVLDDLALTNDQRTKADAILERSAPRTEEVMFDVAARLQAVSDSVDRELRLILTPTQRAKLDLLRHRPIYLLKRQRSNGTTSVDTIRP
jgi:hypothetical protein